jgi:hypothetical protein
VAREAWLWDRSRVCCLLLGSGSAGGPFTSPHRSVRTGPLGGAEDGLDGACKVSDYSHLVESCAVSNPACGRSFRADLGMCREPTRVPRRGFPHKEAPQEDAEEEAQENAEGDALAATRWEVAERPTSREPALPDP